MTAQWVEKLTGTLEHKRSYRAYKARVRRLPDNYRSAVEALERYFTYFGGISDGEVLVRMLDDLATLFEGAASDATSVHALVGENPVDFAETFIANYSEGQWINKERLRLIAAISRVAHSDSASEEGGS